MTEAGGTRDSSVDDLGRNDINKVRESRMACAEAQRKHAYDSKNYE